jgi:hypothetical protein
MNTAARIKKNSSNEFHRLKGLLAVYAQPAWMKILLAGEVIHLGVRLTSVAVVANSIALKYNLGTLLPIVVSVHPLFGFPASIEHRRITYGVAATHDKESIACFSNHKNHRPFLVVMDTSPP